jgi:hypothetical protein
LETRIKAGETKTVKIDKSKLKQLIQEEAQKLLQEQMTGKEGQTIDLSRRPTAGTDERGYPIVKKKASRLSDYEKHMIQQQAQLRRASKQSLAQNLERTRDKSTGDWGKGMTRYQLAGKQLKDEREDPQHWLNRAGRGFAQMDWPITSDDPVRGPHYYDKEQGAWYPLPHGWHTKGPRTGQQYHPQPEAFVRAPSGFEVGYPGQTVHGPPQPAKPQATAGEDLAWAAGETALLAAPLPIPKGLRGLVPRLKPLPRPVRPSWKLPQLSRELKYEINPATGELRTVGSGRKGAITRPVGPGTYDDFLRSFEAELEAAYNRPVSKEELTKIIGPRAAGHWAASRKWGGPGQPQIKPPPGIQGAELGPYNKIISNREYEEIVRKFQEAVTGRGEGAPKIADLFKNIFDDMATPVVDSSTGEIKGWVLHPANYEAMATHLGLVPRHELHPPGGIPEYVTPPRTGPAAKVYKFPSGEKIDESISKSKFKKIISEEYNKLLKEHAAQYVWGVKAPYNRVANKYNLHRMSSEKLSKLKL